MRLVSAVDAAVAGGAQHAAGAGGAVHRRRRGLLRRQRGGVLGVRVGGVGVPPRPARRAEVGRCDRTAKLNGLIKRNGHHLNASGALT